MIRVFKYIRNQYALNNTTGKSGPKRLYDNRRTVMFPRRRRRFWSSSMRHAICDMQHATCDMQHATCNMRHVRGTRCELEVCANGAMRLVALERFDLYKPAFQRVARTARAVAWRWVAGLLLSRKPTLHTRPSRTDRKQRPMFPM